MMRQSMNLAYSNDLTIYCLVSNDFISKTFTKYIDLMADKDLIY